MKYIDSLVKIALIILAIFGFTFFIKLFILLLNVSLSLSNFVIGIFNFFLNILGILIGILAPIIVIISISLLVIYLFKLLITNIDSLKQLIITFTNNRPEKILPIFLAGGIQILLFLLSEDFAPAKMKSLLTLYLWIFTTIILMSIANKNSKNKIKRNIFLFFITFLLICFSVIKYQLYKYTIVKTLIISILLKIGNLSKQNFFSLILICAFLLTMIYASVSFNTNKAKNPALKK